MKRKVVKYTVLAICITTMVLLAGCGKKDVPKVKIEVETEIKTKGAAENKTEESQTELFEQLPQGFDFSSGAGGWGTHFDLNPDGTFTGQYHDSEMGDVGEGYSNGTVYICNFNGKFTTPKQIDEYTYSMKLEYLNTEETSRKEYYEDEIRYIYSEPYGFDKADEFLIYFPGIHLSDLPDEFVSWLRAFLNVETTEILPYYGIYNVGGEEGFVAYDSGTK